MVSYYDNVIFKNGAIYQVAHDEGRVSYYLYANAILIDDIYRNSRFISPEIFRKEKKY